MSSWGHVGLIGIAAASGVAIGLLWWRRTRPARLSQAARVWLTALGGSLGVAAIAALLSENAVDSTIGRATIVLMPFEWDSWGVMTKAIDFARDNPGADIYQELFFTRGERFQYPVASLLLLDLPQRLLGTSWHNIITAVNLLAVPAMIAIGVVAALLWLRADGDGRASWSRRAIVIAVGVASVLLYEPVTWGVALGQIQTFMTLAAALALLAWQRDKRWIAGVLIGLCCIVKPQWGVLLLWAALRRQWGFVVAAAATAGALFLLSGIVYGFGNLLSYVHVLTFLGQNGESYVANQSVTGLLNRALFLGPIGEWDGRFPESHPVVRIVTILVSCAVLGLALLWRTARMPTTIEVGIVMLSLTIASPVAWTHHYGVLLPIFAVALPAALRHRAFGRWTIPAFLVSYVLTGVNISSALRGVADTSWNFLLSSVLLGAVIALVLLYRVSWLERRATGPGSAATPPTMPTATAATATPGGSGS